MPSYSKRSLSKLATCHFHLQLLFDEVIRIFDNSILEGRRGKDKQNRLFRLGFSKLKWPKSKHNKQPSLAVDAVPYPIRWSTRSVKDFPEEYQKDIEALIRFYYFGGLVKGIASQNGIKIRWGGDWDGDNVFTDQNFFDLAHFELDE